jgi:Ca2+/Na+ antiporter
MNIILKILLRNLSLISEKQQSDIENEDTWERIGVFKLYEIMDKNRLFYFGILMFILFGYFLHTKISLGIIFGFALVCIIYYLFLAKTKEDINDYVTNQKEKLDYLNDILSNDNLSAIDGSMDLSEYYIELGFNRRKSYLYLNPVAVEFYYSVRKNTQWSYKNYQRSLQYMNLLIYLKSEMLRGVAYRKYQFEVLQDLRKKCLNYFQAIIMTYPISETPETGRYIKFTESLRILQEITQNIIDEAKKKVEEQNLSSGINTEYAPIELSGPAPDDTKTFDYDARFDFFT